MMLSIAMIVKNEEKNIERCLKAIQKLEDKLKYEIVIVDTGSDDDTLNIARRYTQNVYEHEWNNNFADMRNKSINYCKGEWILVLDADEVLENPESLVEFFKKEINKKCNSAAIKFKNIFSENENKYVMCSMVRLFKKCKELQYKGNIHEQPQIIAPTVITDISVLHYGYSRVDYSLMKYKYERNKKLLLDELKTNQTTSEKVYTYFQLAQTYGMANKIFEATESIYKAFEIVQRSNDNKKYLYVYHFLGMNLLSKGNFKKAVEIAEEAIKYSEIHLDFYYILSKGYCALNKYEEANKYYEKYFELHKKLEEGYFVEDLSVNNGSFCNKQEVLKDKIICDFNNENIDNIEDDFNQLDNDNDKKQLQEIYLYTLIKKNKIEDIQEYFDKHEMLDGIIQAFINAMERIDTEFDNLELIENKKIFLGIDNRLDLYMNCKYYKNFDELKVNEIDFNNFYRWKAEILKYSYLKSKDIIKNIIETNKEDMLLYIKYLSEDYICLQNLKEFSETNFFTCKLNELVFISIIEETLLLSKSIDDDKYSELVKRAYINKKSLMNKVYSKEIISSKYNENIFNNYENIWFELDRLIKKFSKDRLAYIKGLRKLLNRAPEYNKLFKFYLNQVGNDITEEMIKEKTNLLNNVKKLLENNEVDKSLEILVELNNIFRFDEEVLNLIGIALYIKGDYKDSINNLALANTICENSFDTVYNLACALEADVRILEAKEYYLKAYDLTDNKEYRSFITEILKNIRQR